MAETVISTHPVNFRDSAGEWQPINDNLVQRDGKWQNAADADQATLPDALGSEDASLTHNSESLSFRLRGATGIAQVSGSTASYPASLAATNVTLGAIPSGIKETLTLTTAGAPSVFRYDLRLSAGLTLALTEGGAVLARDSAGSVRFVIPAPTVHDANGVQGSASYALAAEPGGWELTLTVDGAWLANSGRAWPVVVDPTVEDHGGTVCTLKSTEPSRSECNAPTTYTETQESGGSYSDTTLSVIQWNLSSIPAYATVDNATASLPLETTTTLTKGQETKENQIPITASLYPTSHVWDMTADWYDAIVPHEGSPIPWGTSHLNTTNGGISIQATGGCGHLGGGTCKEPGFLYSNFEITSIAQGWVSGTEGGNVGLAISHVIDTEQHSTTAYAIVNNGSGPPSSEPQLTITWHVPTGKLRQYQYSTYPLTDRSNASVNVRTGNLEYENSDLTLAGPGVPFSETRLYNSMRTGTPLDLSMGWKFSYGRETTCSPFCNSPAPVIDGPDGVVYEINKSHSAPNAAGLLGTQATEGGDAVWTTGEKEGTGKKEEQLMYNDGIKIKFPELAQGSTDMVEKIATRDGLGWVLKPNTEGCTHNPALSVHRKDESGEGEPQRGYLRASMTVNCSNQVTSIVDSTGREWKYGYDSNGRLISYTDAAKQITSYSYTQYGEGNPATTSLLTEAKTPGGRTLKIKYVNPVTTGIWGRVESITQTINGTHNATTQYSYNEAGQAPCGAHEVSTTITDPLNRKETDCFDDLGRPTHYFDYYSTYNGSYGNEREGITYSSNSQGHPATSNPTGTNGPSTYKSTYSYEPDNTGRLVASSNPLGDVTDDTYGDSSNPYLPTLVTDAQGQAQSMTYSGTGDLLTVKALKLNLAQPEQEIFTWKSGLMEAAQLGPVQDTTTFHYDSADNLSEVNPPVASINPLGHTKYTYNPRDLVEAKTDGRGDITSYEYDNDNRVVKLLFSDGSGIRYQYDGDGNLLKREACVQCNKSGETVQTSTYTYDGLGTRLTETLPNIPATIPIPESPGQYASIVYTRNTDGTLASITDAGGTVNYTYNHDGLVSAVSDPATTALHSIQYHYDLDESTNPHPQGLLESVTYPNAAGSTVLTTNYKYDNDDHTSGLESLKTGQGTPLQSWRYDYSAHALGQGPGAYTALRQWVTNTAGQAVGYQYDYLDRLTKVDVYASNTPGAQEVEQYKYCYNACSGHSKEEEGASNLLQKTYTPYTSGKPGTPVVENYTYDIANQLLTAAGVNVGHDANGNNTGHGKLPGSELLAGNAILELSFNAANQVSQLNTPLTVGGEAKPEALTYEDATNSALASVGSTKFENTELGVSGTIPTEGTKTYFTRGPEGELLDKRTGSEAQYYLSDDRGTVTGTTDTTGTLKQSSLISYDPWGNTANTIPAFGYLGAYQTPGGLDHFGQRFYDPNIGRWTQADSQSHTGDLSQGNPYEYANDDPINESDPEGTCTFDRDVKPPIFSQGNYTYIEICGTHGKKAGRRIGYIRIATPAYRHAGGRSLAGRIVEGTVGATVVVAAGVAGTLCSAAGIVGDDPDLVTHCILGAGGGILSGALAIGNALE